MVPKMKWILFLLLLVNSPGLLAELYKYKNEDGAVVIGQSVPPKLARYGYAILSDDGRQVLEVVPRALTEAEMEEASLNEEALAAEREQKLAQQKADEILKRLYADPSDVIYARDIKLKQIDKKIALVQSRRKQLESQQKVLMVAAADIERSGGTVDKPHLDKLKAINNSIASADQNITAYKEEKTQAVVTYQKDYERLQFLYDIDIDSASVSPDKMDTINP